MPLNLWIYVTFFGRLHKKKKKKKKKKISEQTLIKHRKRQIFN
jgi:hypothetical protein